MFPRWAVLHPAAAKLGSDGGLTDRPCKEAKCFK